GGGSVVGVPEGARRVRVDDTGALGAEIVVVAPGARESRAAELDAERILTIIPPYDHPHVIAGQGTVGLEIVADLPDVEVVLVPVGGGGLASGAATAVKALAPRPPLLPVHP